MKFHEYLLICLSEEASEVIAELLDESVIDSTNIDIAMKPKLIQELIDFNAVTQMLFNSGTLPSVNLTDRLETQTTLRELAKLMCELQYHVSKLLRFGIGHLHPATNVPGVTNVVNVISQIKAFTRIIHQQNSVVNLLNADKIEEKINKVHKYARQAYDAGRLEY